MHPEIIRALSEARADDLRRAAEDHARTESSPATASPRAWRRYFAYAGQAHEQPLRRAHGRAR